VRPAASLLLVGLEDRSQKLQFIQHIPQIMLEAIGRALEQLRNARFAIGQSRKLFLRALQLGL
jgi:hypothetical protein